MSRVAEYIRGRGRDLAGKGYLRGEGWNVVVADSGCDA